MKTGRNTEAFPIRLWAKVGIVLVLLAAIFGGLVLVSGLVPIKASSGHWPLTRSLLQFGKQRSVSTHSINVEVPDLDSPRMIVLGAGQYDVGCRACHAAPGERMPRIARSMMPPPPRLDAEGIGKWEAAELHHIVQHGIKFTGMPAWPSQERPDEVWAMVAFLRELPQLDAVSYARLARGDAAGGADAERPPLVDLVNSISPIVRENCSRCHGADGNGRGLGAFPKLAGQRESYLHRTLQAYSEGARHSGIMGPVAASLSDRQMIALAKYYSRLKPTSQVTDPGLEEEDYIRRGAEIAGRGIPEEKVPSCVDCHGPGSNEKHPDYPSLTGQYPEYLELQLRLFQKSRRGGSGSSHLMHHVAPGLSAEDIRAVAHYYASLPPDD